MVYESYALCTHMKVFDEERYSSLSFVLEIRKYLSSKIKSIVQDTAGPPDWNR